MALANSDIRIAAFENGIKHWEIAKKMGIGETTLSRRLRNELPEEEKEKILSAIGTLAASRKANPDVFTEGLNKAGE